MADRENDDRTIRPLPVFNGAMAGMRKNGDVGDSYSVWCACLIINLRAKHLLSMVTATPTTTSPMKMTTSHPPGVVKPVLLTS
jgi:hypothetical protein